MSSDIKSKNRTDFKKKSKEKGKFPFGEHCRRPECMKRGTHTTHRQKDCRYKDAGHPATYSNLGKAPSKKTEYNSKGAKAQQTFAPSATTTDRRCYMCNDPNHWANACPQRSKHKQNAKTKLTGNANFLALYRSSFPNQDEQACATRMIDYWDEEHLCPSCLLPSHFANECNINETHVTQHVNPVRKKI